MPDPGLLALWNDIEPGREAEYDRWHAREHVPERVSAPLFRSGRRYVDRAHATHRYFTLYDVAEMVAFDTPEYRDLLQNPTPWSASMRPSFRNFLRAPCRLVGDAGVGLGAALAVLRLPADAAPGLDGLAAADGMVRARLGYVAESQHHAGWQPPAPGADAAFAAVLLLEALDRPAATAAFAAACAALCPRQDPVALGGVYDLASIFPGADPAERLAHRRPGWPACPQP